MTGHLNCGHRKADILLHDFGTKGRTYFYEKDKTKHAKHGRVHLLMGHLLEMLMALFQAIVKRIPDIHTINTFVHSLMTVTEIGASQEGS